MRRVLSVVAGAFLSLVGVASAQAALSIHIDQTTQRMTVRENGNVVANWSVSTARQGKITPNGSFRPYTLRQRHFSSLYNNAPMPYSIFFRGNYAIHGTTAVGMLGQPASAGCIRLLTANARQLFGMVQRHGMGNTRISITGRADHNAFLAMRRANSQVARATTPRGATAVQTARRQPAATTTARATRVASAQRAADRTVGVGRAARPAAAAIVPVSTNEAPHWAGLRGSLR